MRFNRLPGRAGFTLIEIGLVMGVVILLVLALIPAFRPRSEDRRFPVLPAETPSASASPEAVPSVPMEPAAPPLPLSSTPAPTEQ